MQESCLASKGTQGKGGFVRNETVTMPLMINVQKWPCALEVKIMADLMGNQRFIDLSAW
jgi:hypothetical protein